jgi:hypothetical protein
MIHLDLEQSHFQIIIQCLGKQPYEIVAPVMAALAQQVQAQQGGALAPPVEASRPQGNGGLSG